MSRTQPRLIQERCRPRGGHRYGAWALLLALALVGSQALGLAHALWHGGALAVAAAGSAPSAAPDSTDPQDAFGHKAGGATCLAWAGVLAGDLLTPKVHGPGLEPRALGVLAGLPEQAVHQRAPHAFDARGPPGAVFFTA